MSEILASVLKPDLQNVRPHRVQPNLAARGCEECGILLLGVLHGTPSKVLAAKIFP